MKIIPLVAGDIIPSSNKIYIYQDKIMVSVFVIVSNFLVNRVGKVGPSSHSSVSIPETSAASHTDQGKEAQ